MAILLGIQLTALKKSLSIAVEVFSPIFKFVFYVRVGNQFHSKTPLNWLIRETLQKDWYSRAIVNDVKIIHFLFCQGSHFKGKTNKVPKSVKFSSLFHNNSLQ